MEPIQTKDKPDPLQMAFAFDQVNEEREEPPEAPRERKPEEPPYVFYVPIDCR